MADLISRAAAIAELMQMVKAHEHDIFRGELLHYTGIKAMLEAQPAVDAAPVVRCKDCMYFRPWRHDRGDDSRCEFWNAEIGAEDYCSQAIYLNNKMDSERRDSDA